MLNPEQLREEEFEVSVLGGYKREAVDVFFKAVIDDYEKLYNDNAELIRKLKVCVNKIDEYKKDEQFLKTAIINAEKLNENTLKDIESREKQAERAAKETADSIIAQAKDEAENIVKRARLDSEESIRAYEIDAARKINEIKSNVQAEEKKLELIKKEVSDFKDAMFKLYKQHLNAISKLPSVVKEHQEDIAPDNSAISSEMPVHEDKNAIYAEPNDGEEKNSDVKGYKTASAPETSENVPVYAGNVSSSEKTAEFVIEKKQKKDSKLDEIFEHNLKYKDLKFGADFDLHKDN